MGASAVCAQGVDDSYKGPPQGGGLDGQMRGLETPPAGAPSRGRSRCARRRTARTPDAGHHRADTHRHSILPRARSEARCRHLRRGRRPTSSAQGLFMPLDRASFLEQVRDVNAAPRFPDWRSIRADALVVGNVGPGSRRAHRRRVPPVGRDDRTPARRAALRDERAELAPRRPHHRRPGLRAADGREGVLRHACRVRRRDGPEGSPREAARDHGSGRQEHPSLEQRPGAGADAALLADQSGDHLHVVRGRAAARVPHEPRERPARDRRRLPRHDVCAALLARRPARRHEPAVGGQLEHLRVGSALAPEAPPDPGHVHRHQPQLLARRAPGRVRIGPRRQSGRST